MSKSPNILLIQADQLRYDCLGYSQAYPVKTPHLDRLAAKGVWFSNAYTPTPLCGPSRQALMNGRRAESFGSLWNYDNALKTGALEPSEYAWPRDLQAGGYRNGFIGKWHVHPKQDPMKYGYDDYISNDEYHTMRQDRYEGIQFKNGFFGEVDPVQLEDTHTHWSASKATQLINLYAADRQTPWHIHVNFVDPHPPCRPAEPFASMYSPADVPKWHNFDDDLTNKPYIQKQQLLNWGVDRYTWEDYAPTVAFYYGLISQLDDAVGKVLQSLDDLGIAEQTLVIFTSDHGDLCGGHRMMDKHYVLYDDVVKVPMILSWPGGKIPKGVVCDEFVYNALDLPPTLLEVANLPFPDHHFHGETLVPLWDPNQRLAKLNWRQSIVSTYNGQQFGLYTQRMLRTNKWKYVWNLTDLDELYDLVDDKGELINRIHHADLQPIVAELRLQLLDELVRVGDGLVNAWTKNQLIGQQKW